jgi:uncharacterized membrane protein HdeD (DUF308 family)
MFNKSYKLNLKIIKANDGGEFLKYSKWTLIIVGIILLVMGIAGLPGVSDMGTEPDWHAVLKIIIGIVAVIVALMDKQD